MARKKTTPAEELEQINEAELLEQAAPESEGTEPSELPEAVMDTPEDVPPADAVEMDAVVPEPAPDLDTVPPEWENDATVFDPPAEVISPEVSEDAAEPSEEIAAPLSDEPAEMPAPPVKTDRQNFFDLDFNDLDRSLTAEERQEWNSIYASYRGRSALTGTIIGVDPHTVSVRNGQTGKVEQQTMYCAVVVPYRVRIVIPAAEMWEKDQARPDFVLRNMVGAKIDFIIIKVDREGGFAIASRRLACRARRRFLTSRPALQREGAQLRCRVLSVGPRRCLVECYGHDLNLTQRELRYTAIPDLRDEYHPGQELDCILKGYDPAAGTLRISVKETESNPFEGAEVRHPVGSRRQAVIAGKYGGGVFCNLPDGTVCMCNYSYQHEDSDFVVGDTVIVLVQRFERQKQQMYGKILTKW